MEFKKFLKILLFSIKKNDNNVKVITNRKKIDKALMHVSQFKIYLAAKNVLPYVHQGHIIFIQIHSAVADTSKTVPGKSWLKFKNRDDQSTTLSILVEKLELPITAKCPKVRPKNEA